MIGLTSFRPITRIEPRIRCGMLLRFRFSLCPVTSFCASCFKKRQVRTMNGLRYKKTLVHCGYAMCRPTWSLNIKKKKNIYAWHFPLSGYLPKILQLRPRVHTNYLPTTYTWCKNRIYPIRVHDWYLECSFLYFSMKREGCVVINTGNFLHSFAVDLEKLRYRYLVFSHQL